MGKVSKYRSYWCSHIFLFVFLFAQASNSQSHSSVSKTYSWGTTTVESKDNGLRLKVGLQHVRDIRRNSGLDKMNAAMAGGKLFEVKPAIEPLVFWIELPPGSKVKIRSLTTETDPVPLENVSVTTGYTQANDSSAFIPLVSKLQAEAIRDEPVLAIEGYDWYRGLHLARLRVMPMKSESGVIKSVQSLEAALEIVQDGQMKASAHVPDPHFEKVFQEMIVNHKSDKQAAIEPLQWFDTTGQWINYASEYLKMAIANDAIYRLTGSALAVWIPALFSVNPATFQLFNLGKQVPLRIVGGDDGQLDPQDFIEFVGTKNYGDRNYRRIPSPAEENPLYMNRYSDTSYYWLTWGDSVGLRTDSSEISGSPLDTLRWFTERVHLESDQSIQHVGTDLSLHQDPRWLAGDVWSWGFLDPNGSFDVPFTVIDPSTLFASAKLVARYSSWAVEASSSPAHRVTIHLNNSAALKTDSLLAYQHGLTEVDVPSSSIISGVNQFQFRSQATASSVNRLIVDWFDVEYPRILKANGDNLVFEFQNLSSRQLRAVEISNVSDSNVVIYKTSSPMKRLTHPQVSGPGPYTLAVLDTVGNGDRYILMGQNNITSPPILSRKTFKNLRDPQLGADYIVVTTERFSATAGQYRSLIQSKYAMRTVTVFVEDIFDEFGFGYPTPESLQEFLKSTTSYWQLPMPSYVLLAGDGSYEFKNVNGVPDESREKNIIPPLGYPVSDPMLAVFTSLPVPQMYIGRIAVSSESEFQIYYNHVNSYLSAGNDDWNKRYVLFSGGNPSLPAEMEAFKQVHLQIAANMITPAPVGGVASVFYKRTVPYSDYGLYTRDQVDKIIGDGAVFVDYIGHSGTQTWDNGISSPDQLRNNRQRFPLILDSGCSTGKFAEPYIKAFGELFTVGQSSHAIGYIGNSALGFTSIAQTLPQELFRKALLDSVREIGKMHLLGKIARSNLYGGPGQIVNRIMFLTNTLLGDPVIRLAVPDKPNLSVESSGIVSTNNYLTDEDEAAEIKVIYANTGSVPPDSFSVQLRTEYLLTTRDTVLRRKLPLFQDTIAYRYSIKDRPGEHKVIINLNPTQTLQEIDFATNQASGQFVVASNALKPLYGGLLYELAGNDLVIMNPQKLQQGAGPNIILQVDTGNGFGSGLRMSQPRGLIVTKFQLGLLAKDRVYKWRSMVENSNKPWTEGTVAFSSQARHAWHPSDSSGWAFQSFNQTRYAKRAGAALGLRTLHIRGESGGYDDGPFGSIEVNGINVVGNVYDRGHHVAVLDSSDSVINARSFDTFGSTAEAESLRVFLEGIVPGDIVAEVISGEGSVNLSAALKNAIKSVGSAKIDSVGFLDSWAIIGWKGAPPGTVPELLVRRFSGRAIVETTFVRQYPEGQVSSSLIGPSGLWNEAKIQSSLPGGSSLLVDVVGVRPSGAVDTLLRDQADSTISLDSVDAKVFPNLRLIARLAANNLGVSPTLEDWSVSFTPPAEFSLNDQSVSVSPDSVLEGEAIQISASILNIGGVAADSVVSRIQAITQSGTVLVGTMTESHVGVDSSFAVNGTFLTSGHRGINTILLEVDPDQKIPESYKVNNVYAIPVFVRADTVAPLFDVTFDGSRIFDGDYVSVTPEIRVSIRDNSPLAIVNPANATLKLNNRRITLGAYPDSLFETKTGAEKAAITFRPRLSTGDHVLSIQVSDASGNLADTSAMLFRFKVETDSKILQAFNYPNPFADGTNFTFNLTGAKLPEELVIKIYTVAGRLIREMKVQRPELRFGFNSVSWDGRDADGGELANGVYFYKMMMTVDDKTEEVIQKLAKIK